MSARWQWFLCAAVTCLLIASPGRRAPVGKEPDQTQTGKEQAETPTSTAKAADDAADDSEKIDFDKARRLLLKLRSGEKLTPDEQKYLQRARAARRRGNPQRPGPARSASKGSAGQSSLGLIPLTDMTADDRYKSRDGGLYGGGRNTPPADHLAAALSEAEKIVPRDAEGNPSADGKIVMISGGMSNTTQEFSQFVRLAGADPGKSPRLQIVDCAQGGQEALDWAQAEKRFRRDRPNPWDVMMQRLGRAEVSPQQVQVAWMLQARRNPRSLGEFPKHAEEFQGHMVVILNKLKERFPNLRLVYLSSRIYAGYASTALNPEPYAYEYGFAVRSLIQEQIKGSAALNYDSERGAVKSPLLLWGPYLWADGTKGRKTDDLVWRREDLAGDGTHPSQSGRQKVAAQLLKFLKTDPTAKTWFLKEGAAVGDSRTPGDPAPQWVGTWQADGSDDCKELRCVARHVDGNRWEAAFTGVCSRRFSFNVAMQGRTQRVPGGGEIAFLGRTDLGEENGGVYRWTGRIVGATFTGRYESSAGKQGTFAMKPAEATESEPPAPNEGKQAAVKSGQQPGESIISIFQPLNVTGPFQGEPHCLVCENGLNPVVMLFAREPSENLVKLLVKLDAATAKNRQQEMGSFVVFLSDEENLADQLKEIAKKHKLKHVVLSIDPPAGPEGFNVSKQADLTVVLYREYEVKANHTFNKGQLSERAIEKILADVPKILAPQPASGKPGE